MQRITYIYLSQSANKIINIHHKYIFINNIIRIVTSIRLYKSIHIKHVMSAVAEI